MVELVVDASVAIEWVVEEEGSDAATTILDAGHRLHAPDLLIPECGNILWKMVRRGEATSEEAGLMAGLLQRAAVELVPARPLMAAALRIAVERGHPAHDATYLALALDRGCPFVTADGRLARVLAQRGSAELRWAVTPLAEAGAL